MINQATIDRINELYRKSKAEGLTTKEQEEQARLRRDYVNSIKVNLRANLESIKIQNPDGSIIDVKKRHDEKYGTGNES